MKRKPKKEIERISGIIPAGLIDKVPKDYRCSIESLMLAAKYSSEAADQSAENTTSLLELCLHYIGNSNAYEVKLTRKLVQQLPNAKFN